MAPSLHAADKPNFVVVFNRENDIGEKTNIIKSHSKIVQELKDLKASQKK